MNRKSVPIEPTHDMVEAAYPILAGMSPRHAREACRQIYATMLEYAPRQKSGRLTIVQRQVLEIITETIDHTGAAPTIVEIRDMLGDREHSRAYRARRQLHKKRLILIGPGPRDIQVLIRPEEV